MKKIININLSGRVIPIEDAAYESLQRYIESLRRYFAQEDGRDEIINDIESRIAELMNDKVKKGAAAVTEADIDEIIHSMGRVEDFEQADATEGPTTGGAYTQQETAYTNTTAGGKRFKGRLYRDRSDKILGGVCAGIANYMNVDPAIIRLLFAIITFGGFGLGVFLYILAWIILPARELDGYVGKRLFRNPEDKILGGVAGGLAAYFNKDTWMIRLIFAAPLLLNILFSVLHGLFNTFHNGPDFPDFFFGSFTGTFLLAYIILWIVLPEARSAFEKMEMRGEKVDVNRIKQNVQNEMESFKTQARAFGEEVKSTAQHWTREAREFAGTRGKTFATEFSQTARPVASGIGHAIGVLFKAFFLFIAGTIAFALFVAVLVFISGGMIQPLRDFMLNGFWQNAALWGTLVFFLAVPLVGIITWIVRRLMKVRSQNRYLGWTFSGLWTLGWFCLIFFIASMVKDWRYSDRIEQNIPVALPAQQKLTVRIDEPAIRYSGTFDWIHDNDNDNEGGWDLTQDSLSLSTVKIRVDKSPDSFYHVTLFKYSQGRNRNEARQRAERIEYRVSSLDSALVIGSGFSVIRGQKFRGQRVIVEIKVPVGKEIRFDETVTKLKFSNIRIAEHSNNWRRNRWNRDWDGDWDNDSYYNWEPGIDYVMTESGELADKRAPVIHHPAPDSTGVYEYRGSEPTGRPDSLRRVIEERERQLEEDRRRLEQAEGRESTTLELPTLKNDLEVSSPIFSLIV